MKIHDTTSNAFIEKPLKIYDETAGAWIEAPSLKTFDETENAWLERLYQGYFTLRQDEYNPILLYDDDFRVTSNEVMLFTAKRAENRRVAFDLSYKWNQDTISFDLVSNGIASVQVGRRFSYGIGYTVGGYLGGASGFYDGTISVNFGTCPDEYEGQTVTNSRIYIEIIVTAESAGNDSGYVNIKNLKFNGKKYGFKE